MNGSERGRRTVRLAKRPRQPEDGRVYQRPGGAAARASSGNGAEGTNGATAAGDDWGQIARIYDLEHPACRGAELRFWDQQVKAGGGAALELAAGSGRVAIALARKGHTITGLELSDGMLARAHAREAHLPPDVRERLEWVQADMATFDLPGSRYGLVFVAYNSFWLLPTRDLQAECLRRMRRHLATGGRIVIDVFPPVADDYKDETGIAQRLAMASRGRAIIRVKDYTYDPERNLAISDVRYYGRPRDDDGPAHLIAEFQYALHLSPPDEMRELITAQGFRIVEEHGTYEGGPIEPQSPRAIYVAVPE